MLIKVPCIITCTIVHMHVHLDTSLYLILLTKTFLDMYDDELDLQNQEELWMSDEEPTDFVFQDVVPRGT